MAERKQKFLLILVGLILIMAFIVTKPSIKYVKAEEKELNSSCLYEQEELMEATVQEQTGIGLGINVITATSVSDFKSGYNILDSQKLQNMVLNRQSLNETRSTTYSTTFDETLLNQYSNSYTFDLGADVFLAAFESGLETGVNFDYSKFSYKYYYILNQDIERYNLYITEYSNPNTYQNNFSSSFLNDLNNLRDGNITCVEFFNRYGTHLVGSAIFGGRLDMIYSIASNEIKINSNYEDAIDLMVSFPNMSTNINADVLASINAEFSKSYSLGDIQTCFNVVAYGGNVFDGTLAGDFSAEYSNWLNSFTDDSNCVIVDYNNGGLVPLWDILPSEYSSLASSMEDCFIELSTETKNEFLSKFKTGNYTDFSGGTGDSFNPYKISTKEQLANIAIFDMTANYQLINDIDLSNYPNWTAIGGHYKQDFFNGVLDGQGYSITHLTRSSDILEQNNRIYFGLFGAIGDNGVVRNLNLQNVSIQMTGPAVNNSNTRVFVGSIAGFCSGVINNVNVLSGTVSYYCQTNGISYVGGLVGLTRGGTINNCTNNSNITSCRYSSAAGGISGYMSGGTIIACVNYGSVTSNYTAWGGFGVAAGIVGEVYSESSYSIINVANNGTCKVKYYAWGVGAKEDRQGEDYYVTEVDYQ